MITTRGTRGICIPYGGSGFHTRGGKNPRIRPCPNRVFWRPGCGPFRVLVCILLWSRPAILRFVLVRQRYAVLRCCCGKISHYRDTNVHYNVHERTKEKNIHPFYFDECLLSKQKKKSSSFFSVFDLLFPIVALLVRFH